MKKLLTFLLTTAVLFTTACSESYDDSALVNRIDNLEGRVQKLEQLCQQMNTNISSLQTIVTALQNNDYITNITPITENGKTIGYKITFAKAQPITIYHGQDGKDGQDGADGKDGKDGKDGYTPVIGVKQDTDGIYYWTLDGEWLLDENGEKIKAVGQDGKDGAQGADGKDGKDGVTPLLKIEDDYWFISYDNGVSWTQLGKATGEDGQNGAPGANGTDGKNGDSFFQSVTQDSQYVYFTLADGSTITLPKSASLDITFAESDLVVMSPNSTRKIGYTVTSSSESVKVEVTSSADIKAKAVANDNTGLTGYIEIKTSDTIDEYSKVIVFVSNGEKVIMKSILFEEAGLVVADSATTQASSDGGEVVLEFLSNVECEVVIPEDAQSWISVAPNSRALERQSITLQLEPNEGVSRSAEVRVKSINEDLSVTYTINQEANIDIELASQREALLKFNSLLDSPMILGDSTKWGTDAPLNEWMHVECNEKGFIEALDFYDEERGNPSFISGKITSEFPTFKYLKRFDCQDVAFTSIDASCFPNIETLVCSRSRITAIDVTNCPKLTILDCSQNPIGSLNVSKNLNLRELYCEHTLTDAFCMHDTKLTSIDVSNNTELLTLCLTSNKISSIDVSNNKKLVGLNVASNNLTSLDLSNNPNLSALDCRRNSLQTLEVSHCLNLAQLHCSDCELSSLDVSQLTKMWWLEVYNNQIQELDVSKMQELSKLYCWNNKIPELDLTNSTYLTELMCDGNPLPKLDISKNTMLIVLGCCGCNMTELDVSNNTKLERLECAGLKITEIDVSMLPELKMFTVNGIKTLDLSANTKLEQLYLSGGILEDLHISNCTELWLLEAKNNKLKTIDLSKNTNLIWLYLSSNFIEELDLSNNLRLREVQIVNMPTLSKIYFRTGQNTLPTVVDDEITHSIIYK